MRLFFISLLLLPLFSIGQKIKEVEIDKFTQERRVKTSEQFVKEGMFDRVGFWYRSVGKTYFINQEASGWGVGVVGDGEKLIFLLDDNQTISVLSTGIQDYTINKYGNYYSHQYSISKDDIEKLANHNLKSIRKYTVKGYSDLDVKDKRQDELKNLSGVFLAELNKSLGSS